MIDEKELFEGKSIINKVGDAVQFAGTISLFVYWSFVPLFCLGLIMVLIAETHGVNAYYLFNNVVGWMVVSILSIGFGAFLQEYRGRKK